MNTFQTHHPSNSFNLSLKPKKFMNKHKHLLLLYIAVILASISCVSGAEAELTGRVIMRAANCFSEQPHEHAHDIEYFVVDEKTKVRTKLNGAPAVFSKLKPDQKIRVKAAPNAQAKAGGGSKATGGVVASGADASFDAGSVEIIAEPAVAAAPAEVGQGAPTLKMLRCLLVFASSQDYPCAVNATATVDRLFNSPTNVNLGMQALTKGHYGIQLGNGTSQPASVSVQLNVNSAGQSAFYMEDLMLAKIASLGYDIYAYDRVLLFPPAGVSNFTAYAYYGSYNSDPTGMVSVYGSKYGNQYYLGGFLHELGHNFGFEHSNIGTNEYADGTCVMGSSHGAVDTECYNVAKLAERKWLAPYPGTEVAVSSDSTLNIYSPHEDPSNPPGALSVSIPGTNYYIGYRTDVRPYARLEHANLRNHVFVYKTTAFGPSDQVANLAPGQVFTGTGVRVIFENVGPNNSYGRVLIDVPSSNAIPHAPWQALIAARNTPKPVTLSATDGDGNPLSYSVVTNPTNGTLSGVAPNLVYTPNAGFLGVDKFTFKANDGTTDSNIAQVSMSVTLNGVDADVSIATTTPSGVEGGASGTFTLTRVGITTGTLSVNLTPSGTAVSGADYTAIASPIVFAANEISKTISVTPVNDTEYEDIETVTLSIAAGTGYQAAANSSATVTIADNDKPTVSVAVNATSLPEGSGGGLLTFSRSGATSVGPLMVYYAPTGTATLGGDYSLLSGSVLIPLGQTSVTVPVVVLQDAITEAPESLIVTVSANTAYNVATSPSNTVTMSISDDDEVNTVNIAVTDNYASEPAKGDGAGTFRITRSGSAASALTVNLLTSGTAMPGSDYVAIPAAVTIPAGQSSLTVTVTPLDEPEAEVDETVILNVLAGAGYSVGTSSTATVNLFDDELAQVQIEVYDPLCAEAAAADAGTFLFRRLGNRTAALTVNYTVSGTATPGTDYTALPGTVSISASNTSMTVALTPINDILVEGTETVILTLGPGTGYSVATQNTGTIEIRDDETVDVNLSIADANAAEGATVDPGSFRITRTSTATTPLTVSYTLRGTATNGTDYNALSGTATIPANATTVDVVVTPINDAILEGTESVIMTLTGGGATYDVSDTRTQTLWVKDDDTPAITLVATDTVAAEADGGTMNPGLYTFTASFAPANDLTLFYTVSGGTNGVDYDYLTGTIMLLAGQTSVTLALNPIDDELAEALESVGVTLSHGPNYNRGATTGGSVAIAASDKPVATITAVDSAAAENPVNTGKFLITLSKVVAASTTVTYTVGGTATTGADYTTLAAVSIAAGSNTALITVTPLNDALIEGPESVTVTLTSAATYTVGSSNTATVTIADDEISPPLAAWKQANFGADWNNELITGDLVDYDKDGLPNLMEYALSTNPNGPTEPADLSQSSIASNSLVLTFNRNVANTDITIIVQGSDNLNTWTDLASSVNGATTNALVNGVSVSESGTGSSRTVEVVDLYTTSDPTHPHRFMRIAVSH